MRKRKVGIRYEGHGVFIYLIMELLPDEILTKVLAWTSLTCHGNLRTTCKKFKSIVDSEQFRTVRITEGFAESAIVAFGRRVDSEGITNGQIWALLDGRWRQTPWMANRDEFLDATVITSNSTRDSFLFAGNNHDTFPAKIRLSDGERGSLPPHLEGRLHPAVCHFGKCTILAGGFNPYVEDYTSSVEMFDPEIGAWTELPSMPHGTSNAVAGVIGEKIYIAGGLNEENGFNYLRILQIYDTISESWEIGPPMPEPLDMLSGAVVNGKFYVVGRPRGTGRRIYTCFTFYEEEQMWTETSPICSILGVTGIFYGMEDYRAIEHNGRLLVLRCNEATNEGIDVNPEHRPALQLEDNGKWSKIPLTTIPDVKNHLMVPIEGITSVVLG